MAKLKQRRRLVKSKRLRRAISAYVEYLKMGGKVRFAELETGLLVSLLARGRPILTGLSATYLYGTAREYREESDDGI